MSKVMITTITILLLSSILILNLVLPVSEDESVLEKLEENSNKDKTRKSTASGSFYPASEKELSSFLEENLKEKEEAGTLYGLIAPHAGYSFSGKTAAKAFKNISGNNIDTVIILANSHHHRFQGASVYSEGFYETPLEKVKIDKKLA